jgi:hypothetical protein
MVDILLLTIGGECYQCISLKLEQEGTVLGITSANISPVININGNTVFSLSTSLSDTSATGTITPLVGMKCYSNCGKYYGK